MQHVFVTGGAGLIGSKLCVGLANLDCKVVSFDNLSGPTHPYINHAKVSHIRGDVSNFQHLLQSAAGCDTFFHLAAAGNVITSIKDPSYNFENNVVGTLNCLNAARILKPKRFVFASTGGAIIGNSTPPITEESIPSPLSPYGASKLAGEGYCQAFASSYGLDITIFRFANVIGEYCLHKKGVLNTYFEDLSKGQNIYVFGDVSRDFIYSTDIVNALIASVTLDSPSNQIYHLCSGIETPIITLAEMMARRLGVPNHMIKTAPSRKGEVQRTFGSAEKARRDLNFICEHSIETALNLTIDWLEANHPRIH